MQEEEKRLTGTDWLIILVFGLAAFFHFRGFGPSEGNATAGVLAEEARLFSSPVTMESEEPGRMLLFILDFRDFSCMVCLESFLELYRRLPLRVKSRESWGILIVPPGQEKDESVIRIAEKKLEGFVRANQIIFPVLVDRYQVFGEMAEKGSGIVLFDEARQMVNRFDFPLDSAQFQKILEILQNKR
jgi:hypothetical protein